MLKKLIRIKQKIFHFIFFFFLINFSSGCGGGSGGGMTATWNTLSILSNGEGVARGIAQNGTEALIYTPDVVAVVAATKTPQGNVGVDASDFPITYQSGYVIIKSGTLTTADGYAANVRELIDQRSGEISSNVFIEDPYGGVDSILTGGVEYINNSPTGTYTYEGTQTLSKRTEISPNRIGNFSLEANFSNDTFNYSGFSGDYLVFGSGYLDDINGRFATTSAQITGTGPNNQYNGALYGLLHGSGGQTTSGLFHSSDYAPDIIGTFVGAKQ